MQGAERRDVGGVKLEVVRAGDARVKRMIYPVGFRWSTNMKPLVHTDQCMHAHVGFLARGSIHIGFPDGCVREYSAPAVIAVEPGHDGWVVGSEPRSSSSSTSRAIRRTASGWPTVIGTEAAELKVDPTTGATAATSG